MTLKSTIIPRKTFDHGQLAGLTDDDHSLYAETTELHTQAHQSSHLSGGADVIANLARIATGTYTGDGALSLAITGLGFQPKFVQITVQMTVNATILGIQDFVWTTNLIVADNASGLIINMTGETNQAKVTRINAIISLDADGFTVDDAGADLDPNKDGIVYNFLAIG